MGPNAGLIVGLVGPRTAAAAAAAAAAGTTPAPVLALALVPAPALAPALGAAAATAAADDANTLAAVLVHTAEAERVAAPTKRTRNSLA